MCCHEDFPCCGCDFMSREYVDEDFNFDDMTNEELFDAMGDFFEKEYDGPMGIFEDYGEVDTPLGDEYGGE